MQDDYKKFQISLESDEGFDDLVKFVWQKSSEFPRDEEEIKIKLLLAKRKMGFKSYSELLDHVEKNQKSLDELFKLLERDHITQLPHQHPKRQRKNLKEYVNITPEKKKKRKKIDLKKVQELLKIKEPPDQQHLPLVLDFLSKKKINFQAYKENYFLRRLHIRMRKVKTPSYIQYQKFLEKNPGELISLVDCLSVNVTRFFRDKELFDVLENEFLPNLLNKPEQVRIWSAGCAIGPEPYSIAMMIKRIDRNSKGDFHILATDISQDFLKKAKEGRFTKECLTEMNQLDIHGFFSLTKSKKYELSPQIRNLVTFKKHDLRTPPPAKMFDLIMCRNVLIYFSKPQSISLFQRFHSVLKTYGYLVLGKCELLPKEVKDKFEVVDAHNRIYQRKN